MCKFVSAQQCATRCAQLTSKPWRFEQLLWALIRCLEAVELGQGRRLGAGPRAKEIGRECSWTGIIPRSLVPRLKKHR